MGVPLPPVPGVVKVILGYTVGDDTTVENVLHWKYTGGPPVAADCQSIAGAANAQYASNLKALCSTGIPLTSVRVVDLSSSTGAEGSNLSVVSGSRVGTELVASACVVMSHKVAQRYRGGHGRSYLPFGTQSDQLNPQSWQSTFLNSCNSAWSAFQVGMDTTTAGTTSLAKQVIVSYYHGGALRGTPAVFDVIGSQARTLIGTQRRRIQ